LTLIHALVEKRDRNNSDPVASSGIKSSQQSTITDGWCNRTRSNPSALICVYRPVSAVKKRDNFLTADDNGLTLIHADEKKRDKNNSDANRFDIICQLSVVS
jgi:hypothetical protein